MIQSIENGRKEDGNRSIADKIIKRLHELDKTVENNQGRWAWELLQNAKDSIADDEGRTVSVQIIVSPNHVEFKHNGTYFTEQDIRGLINQISSKEVQEGEQTKKTGRFGTGFLTTHLLSKIIEVKGVVKTENAEFFSFQFPLDREGTTTPQLVPKIETTWSEFQKSAKQIGSGYDKSTFNTSFGYALNTEEQKNIAKIGIEEFIRLMPFVLAFIPKIESVEILNGSGTRRVKFINSSDLINGFIIPIKKETNDKTESLLIAISESEKIKIASQLLKTENGYSVKNNVNIPKLFCDFPLIGTEKFHFPVIINSFFFHPQTERDGIWLKGKKDGSDIEANENQELVVEAKNLYEKLLAKLIEKGVSELFNISETELPETDEKYFDREWFKTSIQKPIRDLLFNSKIVEIENSTERKSLKGIFFPMKSYGETIQNRIWQYIFDLFPESVCKKDHLPNWSAIYWEECNKINYSTLAATIAKRGTLSGLAEMLNLDSSKSIEWLNNACKFIYEDESNLLLFEKNYLTPNQNGVFLKKSDLFIDEINDFDLVEILKLLGEDWGNILLDKNVEFGEYTVKKKKDIAERITEKLRSPKESDETKKAIVLLSEWFEVNNPDECKLLFSELYRNKAELFMNTISDKESLYKVMKSTTNLSELSRIAETLAKNPELADNIQGAAQLTSLFEEFHVTSIDELKEILKNSRSSNHFDRIEFTSEILANLGVTTQEELEEALKDKDLATLFSHTSTPNSAMFMYAQGLIERAKKNVLDHLESLSAYDCGEMEELANSVIGGIKKDGLAIHVVVRPSDNGTVIVYYTSEKDTLDYENAELWIENGKEKPRLLSLGKILKNTGINKIPV